MVNAAEKRRRAERAEADRKAKLENKAGNAGGGEGHQGSSEGVGAGSTLAIRSAPPYIQNPDETFKWIERVHKEGLFSNPGDSSTDYDATITALEDKTVKELAAQTDANPTLPCRPAYRQRSVQTPGPERLWANYFRINLGQGADLHRYSVSVVTDKDGKSPRGKKLKRIIELLLELPPFAEAKDFMVTDFAGTLISVVPIKEISLARQNGSIDRIVHYRREGDEVPRQRDKQYNMRIRTQDTLNTLELSQSWNKIHVDQRIATNRELLLQCLNIFFGHYAKYLAGVTTIGDKKGFLVDQKASDLGGGIVACRGFFSSIRVSNSRVLLNVNVSHGAFYKPVKLDTLMHEYMSVHGNDIRDTAAFVKRLRVKAGHLPEKDKNGHSLSQVKTIFDLANEREAKFKLNDFDTTGKSGKGDGELKTEHHFDASKFQDAQGKISVYDFFSAKYRTTTSAKDRKLPLVNVGNKEMPCYIPAQVCTVIAGQAYQSKLSPVQTQSMIDFAVRKPFLNAISIVQNGPRTLGLLQSLNAKMGLFHIDVDPRLIKVMSHNLPSPRIKYDKSDTNPQKEGEWNLAKSKFYRIGAAASVLPLKWAWLDLSTNGKVNEKLLLALDKFVKVLAATGLNINPTKYKKVMAADGNLHQFFDDCRSQEVKIALIILPRDGNTAIYNKIKVLGDIEKSLHTVCVIGTKPKFLSESPQYYGNVALKFNLKLGGANHTVESKINGDETMVLGIDVTHPSPGSEGAPSIAAMVASMDKEFSQWPVDLRVQQARKEREDQAQAGQEGITTQGAEGGARQEMVTEIFSMLLSRLKLWQNSHKVLPKNILVYRDGVSEGQYKQVLDVELSAMKRAAEIAYGNYSRPKITIIVVGKRHHTRFFPTSSAQADSGSNTKKGTLVDRGLFEAHKWEFFLQSHTALHGTARPAHYVVIHDEIFRSSQRIPEPCKNSAEWLETVTHNMCYLFGRATRAVSIPAPVCYADVACERARRWLADRFVQQTGDREEGDINLKGLQERITPRAEMKDKMFYI